MPTAVIDDNAPLRVFNISELTRAIASHLIPISRKSAADLARTSRCLEEPVLSALWEKQGSLITLMNVLPEANRTGGLGCTVCDLHLLVEGSDTQA